MVGTWVWNLNRMNTNKRPQSIASWNSREIQQQGNLVPLYHSLTIKRSCPETHNPLYITYILFLASIGPPLIPSIYPFLLFVLYFFRDWDEVYAHLILTVYVILLLSMFKALSFISFVCMCVFVNLHVDCWSKINFK